MVITLAASFCKLCSLQDTEIKLSEDKPKEAGGKPTGDSRFHVIVVVSERFYLTALVHREIIVFSHPQALTARRKTGGGRRSINRNESFVRNAAKVSTTGTS